MKKTVKAMISTVMAIAIIGSMAFPVSADYEYHPGENFPEIPEFHTVEDVDFYFKSIGMEFPDDISEEEIQSFYDDILMYEREKFDFTGYNDDDSNALTILYSDRRGFFCIGLEYDNIRYMIYNGEAYITGSNDYCDVTEYVVPDEIHGCPVVAIGGYAFHNFRNIEKITIPNTVRRIGTDAFFVNLKEIELSHPDEHSDMQIIKRGAFGGTMLEKVTIFGDSDLSVIEDDGFINCYNLTRFDFPDHYVSLGLTSFKRCKLYEDTFAPENGKIILPSWMTQNLMEYAEQAGSEEYYEQYKIQHKDCCDTNQTYGEWKYENGFLMLLLNLGLKTNGHYCGNYEVEIQSSDNSEILYGDVNFDGKVTVKDLAYIKNYLIGNIELSPMQKLSISNDNSINNVDIRCVTRVARKIVGLE